MSLGWKVDFAKMCNGWSKNDQEVKCFQGILFKYRIDKYFFKFYLILIISSIVISILVKLFEFRLKSWFCKKCEMDDPKMREHDHHIKGWNIFFKMLQIFHLNAKLLILIDYYSIILMICEWFAISATLVLRRASLINKS